MSLADRFILTMMEQAAQQRAAETQAAQAPAPVIVCDWQVDARKLRRACDLLGLRKPVEVQLTYLDHQEGRYLLLDQARGCHRIQLDARLPIQRASWALWHELTHALQLERLDCSHRWFLDCYRAQLAKVGLAGLDLDAPEAEQYRERILSIPMEREAERTAARMRYMPIVVPIVGG